MSCSGYLLSSFSWCFPDKFRFEFLKWWWFCILLQMRQDLFSSRRNRLVWQSILSSGFLPVLGKLPPASVGAKQVNLVTRGLFIPAPKTQVWNVCICLQSSLETPEFLLLVVQSRVYGVACKSEAGISAPILMGCPIAPSRSNDCRAENLKKWILDGYTLRWRQ